MYIEHSKVSTYIGKNAGKRVIEDLKSAKKSIKIVSPYLSPSAIAALVKKANEGVDVTLITSEKLEEDGKEFSHEDLIKRNKITDEKSKSKKTQLIIAGLILLFLAFFMGKIAPLFIVGGIICLILGILIKSYYLEYYPLFKIKVFATHRQDESAYLIHSKIFVIDDKVAYLGSINYTTSGFVFNLESCIKYQEKYSVDKISQEVDRIFHKSRLPYIEIEDWGKQIYGGK